MSKQEETTKNVVARVLRAMAYDRETFKDRVEEHVGGAYLEFYKAALAKKNGQTRWVQHWTTEVRNLLDRALVATIKHDVRGFKDKRKAISEVLAAVRKKDASFRRSAELVVKRDFGIDRVTRGLDDRDMAAFWRRVEDAVEVGIAGE